MPGYKVHLAAGAAVAAPMLYLLRFQASSFAITIVWFGCALAGSLFPDIDTTSKGQKWFYHILVLMLLGLLFLKRFVLFVIFTLMGMLPLVVNHRGLFHRFWFVVFVPLAVAFTFSWYSVLHFKDAVLAASFFIAGALSHLLLDFGPRRMFR